MTSTEQDAGDAGGPTEVPSGQDEVRRRGLRALVGRVWRSVLRHRLLFACVIGFAALEAFFTKAPFVLAAPLIEVIEQPPVWEKPVDPDESGVDEFLRWFAARAETFGDWTGLQMADDPSRNRNMLIVTLAAVVAAIAGVFGAFAIYGATLTSRFFATRIVAELRNEIADHLLRLPLRFYGRRRMGDLISSVTNDTTVLSRSFQLASDTIVSDSAMILFNVGLIAFVDLRGLIVFAVLVPAIAIPVIRLGKKVHHRSRSTLAAMGESTESMNQMLGGMRTIKAFQLEDRRYEEFRDSNETWLWRVFGTLRAKGRSQGTTFVGYQLIFAALVLLFGFLLLSGDLELTAMAVLGTALATTYTHVKRLGRTYNNIMESLGALDRINGILHEAPDAGGRQGGRVLEAVSGQVALDGVCFAYDDEQVLTDLSFDVAPGTTVALVGPSGGGKTTTIDLLLRFHDPVAGRVLIDGQDLREIDLASFRRHVALVDQHPFLFNTTVFENIACGLPDGRATPAQVEDAARTAQAHDFIMALPNGYETIVGERGASLSGGQRQRITIARAILRDPAILFLDEATSALDSESEGAVQTALNALMKGRTSFVIAHRLSTVRDADRILVLERGRLVESGTHQVLASREGGLYARLLQLQQMS